MCSWLLFIYIVHLELSSPLGKGHVRSCIPPFAVPTCCSNNNSPSCLYCCCITTQTLVQEHLLLSRAAPDSSSSFVQHQIPPPPEHDKPKPVHEITDFIFLVCQLEKPASHIFPAFQYLSHWQAMDFLVSLLLIARMASSQWVWWTPCMWEVLGFKKQPKAWLGLFACARAGTGYVDSDWGCWVV